MSEYVTLQEVIAIVEPLVVENDVISLINRASERLYKIGATPGMSVEWKVLEAYKDAGSPPVPGAVGEIYADYGYVLIPLNYSSAQFFLIDGLRRLVIPLESKYNPQGYDRTAFVDRGLSGIGRVYEIPECMEIEDINDSSVEVRCVLRKAYSDVVLVTDTLPFQNISAVKLAVLATVYEDENDLERADEYWNKAIRELESDSLEFRGPQDITVSYSDPAAHECTTTIN